MDKKRLSELLQLFSKDALPWIDMARALNQAVDEEIEINGKYITQVKMQELLRAYRLAEIKGILQDPRLINVSSRAISNLVNVEKVINDPERFKKVLEEVLNGKMTATGLEKLSLHEKGKEGRFPYKVLKKRITKLTEDLSDEKKIPEYRRFLAADCAKLVQRLQCIIDEQYYELWKSREEYEV